MKTVLLGIVAFLIYFGIYLFATLINGLFIMVIALVVLSPFHMFIKYLKRPMPIDQLNYNPNNEKVDLGSMSTDEVKAYRKSQKEYQPDQNDSYYNRNTQVNRDKNRPLFKYDEYGQGKY